MPAVPAPPPAMIAQVVAEPAGTPADPTTPAPTTAAPTAPPAPVLASAVATRSGTRMTVRVEYRLPEGTAGAVPTSWRAFAGSRSARRMSPAGQGASAVPVTGTRWAFTASARIGSGTDRAGGFCVVPDFAAVGLVPVQVECAGLARPSRRQMTAHVPEVTVFGDSVAATFDWVPGTREALAKGLSVRYDLRSCRRLFAPPCPPNPPGALQSIRSLPGSLGDIAVIDVGYNDWAATYDVPRVVRALRARGVRRVVWVTLRETQSSYRQINGEIRHAARRSRHIQVADWNRASRNGGYFAPDRVHLTSSGGWVLARFMRSEIRRAVAWLRANPGA